VTQSTAIVAAPCQNAIAMHSTNREVHGVAFLFAVIGAREATISSKRGSPRSVSHTGLSLRSPYVALNPGLPGDGIVRRSCELLDSRIVIASVNGDSRSKISKASYIECVDRHLINNC
jgi:hypothetical protein